MNGGLVGRVPLESDTADAVFGASSGLDMHPLTSTGISWPLGDRLQLYTALRELGSDGKIPGLVKSSW